MGGKRANSNFQIALDATWDEIKKRPKSSVITRKELINLIALKTNLKKDKATIYSTVDTILRIFEKDRNIERVETGKYTIINNSTYGKSFRDTSWRSTL